MSERAMYQDVVTWGQLEHALRGYNNMPGVDIETWYGPKDPRYNRTDNMAIIVVSGPPGGLPSWQQKAFAPSKRTRFRLPAFNWRQWASILCVVTIVGAAGYIIYGVAAGGGQQQTIGGVPVETGGMRLDPASGHGADPSPLERAQQAAERAGDWLRSLLPPQPQPQPQTIPAPWWRFWNQQDDVAQPQTQANNWLPKNPVSDAIDNATQAITWTVYVVIGLCVLTVVLFALGAVSKFRR